MDINNHINLREKTLSIRQQFTKLTNVFCYSTLWHIVVRLLFLVRPIKVYVCNTTTHKHVAHCVYTLTYTYSHTHACGSEISSSAVNREIKDSTSTREYITNLPVYCMWKLRLWNYIGCRHYNKAFLNYVHIFITWFRSFH